MGRKLGALLPFLGKGSWVPIQHNVAWTTAQLHAKYYLDPFSHLAPPLPSSYASERKGWTKKEIGKTSGQKFTILCGHVEDISMLNRFFSIVDTCLSCEDIARQSCAMVPIWRFLATFLRPVFSESRMQQVSDLRLKFALRRPHHVWKYGRHPICSG